VIHPAPRVKWGSRVVIEKVKVLVRLDLLERPGKSRLSGRKGRPGPSRYCQWMSRTRARRSNPAVRRVSALWSRLGQGLGDASQRRHKATRTRQRSSPTSHPCPRRVLSEWGRVSGVGAPRDDTSPGRDPPFGRERLSGSFRAVVMDAGDVANGSVWSTTPRTCLPGPRRRAGAIVGSL